MSLTDRDRAILQLIARFKQATSRQVHELLFPTLSSYTPCNRALRRLTEQQYLVRVERRIAGGDRGGSGQYVYALGRRGYYEYFESGYSPARTVSHHSLAILDCFVTIRQLERLGVFELVVVSTEPDCHVSVGGVLLKPDLYVELRMGGETYKMWFEVDLGTESQKQLLGKLEAVIRAFNEADATRWAMFPVTVWVGVDEARAKELAWLVGRLPESAQPLFRVTSMARLASIFTG